MVIRNANGMVFGFAGCEIDANGQLVAGKIEKRVVCSPNRQFWAWVGCEIEANGKLVAGKIDKRV